MSEIDFKVKQNAIGDWLFIEFGPEIDLASAGAEVRFTMKQRGSTGAPKIDDRIIQIANGTYVIDGVSTVLAPADRVAFVPWAANDLDTPGDYVCEAVPIIGGKRMTRPNYGYGTITISSEL